LPDRITGTEEMYYEEKIIDGILCWRSNPDGEWKKFRVEVLTGEIVRLKSINEELLAMVKIMTALTKIKYGNLDEPIWKKIQESESLIAKAEGK
jgi:hypothetical protein